MSCRSAGPPPGRRRRRAVETPAASSACCSSARSCLLLPVPPATDGLRSPGPVRGCPSRIKDRGRDCGRTVTAKTPPNALQALLRLPCPRPSLLPSAPRYYRQQERSTRLRRRRPPPPPPPVPVRSWAWSVCPRPCAGGACVWWASCASGGGGGVAEGPALFSTQPEARSQCHAGSVQPASE